MCTKACINASQPSPHQRYSHNGYLAGSLFDSVDLYVSSSLVRAFEVDQFMCLYMHAYIHYVTRSTTTLDHSWQPCSACLALHHDNK